MKYGILIVSHVPEIAHGVAKMLNQISTKTPITFAGGTDDGVIGTSLQKICDAIDANVADEILAFYDIGSSKINLELATELSNKRIHIFDSALVESSYVVASLISSGKNLTEIKEKISPLSFNL